ncbi:MAG: fructose-6-phosphate aldolase, partial [Desulfonatronovibrionaceae bacterium]
IFAGCGIRSQAGKKQGVGYMKFFIDTANIQEIEQAIEYGQIDGVTTNPSLMAREGGDWKRTAEKICALVDGPVSLEAVSTDAEGMIKEAKELTKYGPNVVVKIPMTMPGIKAVRTLSRMGVATNVTLVFSELQALMAAKAGADYVSPFVGRLDDIGHNGMDLVSRILSIYDSYAFETEVIVASIRTMNHVQEAAMLGADIATIPYKVLAKLANHPLTDKGLEAFLKDWEEMKK